MSGSNNQVGSSLSRTQTGAYTRNLIQLTHPPSQPELYSRLQYQPLARFLETAPLHTQHSQNHDTYSRGGQAHDVADDFIHVVVHTYSVDGNVRRHDFGLSDGLGKFLVHPKAESHLNQIIFVRGSLSPAWIEALGSRYKIDPEFFRRHLRYLPARDYSDLPSVPSANNEILTLVIPSLYLRSDGVARGYMRKLRQKDPEITRRNQNSISANVASGETVIRRFSTLSNRLFSVEHEISILRRSRKDGGQEVVVLLDNGLEMNRRNGPPCFIRQDSQLKGAPVTGISPIPIIVPRPSTLNIKVAHPEPPMRHNTEPSDSITHVASLLPFYFGMSTNASPTEKNVFLVLGDVFRLAVGSECQFLNQLETLIRDQDLDPEDGETMSLAMDTLRYIKKLLNDHKRNLRQNISFFESCLSTDHSLSSRVVNTSSATTQTRQTQSPDELTHILDDFKELLTLAEALGILCTENVGAILNNAMLRESQRAIQRADDQRRLTVLAYLFLPLTLP